MIINKNKILQSIIDFDLPSKNNIQRSFYDVKSDAGEKIMLNGEWEFAYFTSIHQLSLSAKTKTIKVPHTWQADGYDDIQYTNVNYPFPYNPPYVPANNPCALYTKHVQINKINADYFLTFEGVDSCYFVYVNGENIGYNTVSHSTGEFNITNYLQTGDNVINVIVFKWGVCSYLEDQDKIRLSGIFRDVYITPRCKNRIEDYQITYKILGNTASIKFNAKATDHQKYILNIYFKGLLIKQVDILNEHEFCLNDIKLWHNLEPNVYDIEIVSDSETVYDQIVFRGIEIDNGIIKLNGEPIKFRGVNRHECYADTGYVCDNAKMEHDLALMAKHNINAIRTSHYPPTARFLKLCERYGFYVIDEADLETHGTVTSGGGYNKELFDLIADDSRFCKHIIERQHKLYERDKNRFCVLIWSAGNESGWGVNIEKAIKFLKCDPMRLVHYESLYVRADKAEGEKFSQLDLMSFMYATRDYMDKYFENKDERRPLLLCEYSHSMGNSCGDLKDYQDYFESHSRHAGGFIWEWNDHSMLNAKYKNYLYGGGWGDTLNDNNFCIDGLIKPDRSEGGNIAEVKQAFCYLMAKKISNSSFVLTNKNEFLSSAEYADISYEVKNNGVVTKSGKITQNINPLSSEIVDIECNLTGNAYITFYYYAKADRFAINSGDELGFTQIELARNNCVVDSTYDYIKPKETDKTIKFSHGQFSCLLDKVSGNITSIVLDGEKLLKNPIDLCIERALIDNDKLEKYEYRRVGLYDTKTNVENIKIVDSKVEISFNIAKDSFAPIIRGKMDIAVEKTGAIVYHFNIDNVAKIHTLPRLGLKMALPLDFDKVEYFGYGKNESYIDKRLSAVRDKHNCKICDMFTHYIKPQENGSHYDTEYATIYGKDCHLTCTSDMPLSFNIGYYSLEQLSTTKYDHQLKPENKVWLHLDHKMAGIGSASCGPLIEDKCCIQDKHFDFKFKLSFIK